MTALNKQALRKELLNPAIGSNYHLRKIALSLLGDLDAAENRITELEARKFKVEMPESFYPDGDIDAPLVVDELEVIAAIVEAGGKPVAFCKRCDHEIDLTHRPDGSHYCHAMTKNKPAIESMSLDAAIAHADERASALSGPCAEQHAQLASWLRELQEHRKTAAGIGVKGE